MKNTTFWPEGELLRRLARSYKPGDAGLEECRIDQRTYPLDDPRRQPMPAGGLFSTADDLSRLYRMIANDGVVSGRQILSKQAVREMESPQPGNPHYGLGMNRDEDTIGHGGAYSTDSCFRKKQGLILIFLVQHAGWPKGGEQILGVFHKSAGYFRRSRASSDPKVTAGTKALQGQLLTPDAGCQVSRVGAMQPSPRTRRSETNPQARVC